MQYRLNLIDCSIWSQAQQTIDLASRAALYFSRCHASKSQGAMEDKPVSLDSLCSGHGNCVGGTEGTAMSLYNISVPTFMKGISCIPFSAKAGPV